MGGPGYAVIQTATTESDINKVARADYLLRQKTNS